MASAPAPMASAPAPMAASERASDPWQARQRPMASAPATPTCPANALRAPCLPATLPCPTRGTSCEEVGGGVGGRLGGSGKVFCTASAPAPSGLAVEEEGGAQAVIPSSLDSFPPPFTPFLLPSLLSSSLYSFPLPFTLPLLLSSSLHSFPPPFTPFLLPILLSSSL
ncbi:unnamed protein product [Closterium sp. NIES-64]|nr:unnamed protein product [Closterium sp. NIES-64]